MIIRSLSDTPESNREALSYIVKAKDLNISNNIYVSKQEGITYMRMNEYDNAQASFQTYLEDLLAIEYQSDYMRSEIEWARVMLYKTMQMKEL